MLEIGSNRQEHVFTRNPLVGCCQHCGKMRSDCEKRFQPDQDEAYDEDCDREYIEIKLQQEADRRGFDGRERDEWKHEAAEQQRLK